MSSPPNGLRQKLTARQFQLVLGRPVYFPVVDYAKKTTTIGPLVISHVGHERFKPRRDFSKTPVTETMLERLGALNRSYERGRFVLVNGDYESRALETLQMFADFAHIDFFRMNGYSLATKGDFYGGKRAVPGRPGVFRDAKGFFPTVAEKPSFGVIDQIGFCRADLLPGLLNGLLDFRVIKGRDDAGNLRELAINPRSFFAAVNGPKDEIINNELPPDTADRFRPVTYGALPMSEEKQLMHILTGLPVATLDLLEKFHAKIVEETKDGKGLEYAIRPYSVFDLHRLAQFTVLFKGYFEKLAGLSPEAALQRSLSVQAHDLYFRRIPSAADRNKIAKSTWESVMRTPITPFGAFTPSYEERGTTEIDGKTVRTRLMQLGDVEILVYGDDYINGIEETPFLLDHMRLAAKCRVAQTPVVFRGPSGIGKSASAGHLLKKQGTAYVWQHFERDMGKAEVLGGYDLGEEAGALSHFEAALLKSAKKGLPAVGDEIDNLRSSGHALLFPLVDSGTLIDTEGPNDLEASIIQSKPGHWLFLTCNPVGFYKGKFYEGKSEIPRGLLQHTVEVFVDYADAAQEKSELTAILKPKFKGHAESDTVTAKMVDFYQEMSKVLLAQADGAAQAGSFEQDQVADYMPTKRWLLEWQKGAMARTAPTLVEAVVAEAVDEILSRFKREDLQKIKPIFEKHFPEAQTIAQTSPRATALTPLDFAWANEKHKVPRTELYGGSLDTRSEDFQEGLQDYLTKHKAALAGVLRELAEDGGGNVEEAMAVMAEEAALLAKERPLDLNHALWSRHKDLPKSPENLPRAIEREVVYGFKFLTEKTTAPLHDRFAALVQSYLCLATLERTLVVAKPSAAPAAGPGAPASVPAKSPLAQEIHTLFLTLMVLRDDLVKENGGRGKSAINEKRKRLAPFVFLKEADLDWVETDVKPLMREVQGIVSGTDLRIAATILNIATALQDVRVNEMVTALARSVATGDQKAASLINTFLCKMRDARFSPAAIGQHYDQWKKHGPRQATGETVAPAASGAAAAVDPALPRPESLNLRVVQSELNDFVRIAQHSHNFGGKFMEELSKIFYDHFEMTTGIGRAEETIRQAKEIHPEIFGGTDPIQNDELLNVAAILAYAHAYGATKIINAALKVFSSSLSDFQPQYVQFLLDVRLHPRLKQHLDS